MRVVLHLRFQRRVGCAFALLTVEPPAFSCRDRRKLEMFEMEEKVIIFDQRSLDERCSPGVAGLSGLAGAGSRMRDRVGSALTPRQSPVGGFVGPQEGLTAAYTTKGGFSLKDEEIRREKFTATRYGS
ncbi:hypothetical protein [Streptomyces cinereoruber]|uniref:hypothetical protein n=1 Tax=Streptomyces cinereoruber TaxID=67260 RepID=UPI00363F27B5